MRKIVESLKRLFNDGRLTKAQIAARVEKGTITLNEYNYIIGEGEDNTDSELSVEIEEDME